MVSTHTLISKSSTPWIYPLVTVPRATITIGIIVTFMFNSFVVVVFCLFCFFRFPSKVHVLIFLFAFFQFYKIHYSAGSLFFFFFFFLINTKSGCLRLNDPFVSQNPREVWASHSPGWMPFVRMIKFKILTQFPVNHLPHPVVSSLILFLYKFAAFTLDVIDRFVSITKYSKYAILSRLIYSCFDVKVKLAILVEADPKAPFSIATTPNWREGHYSIPWIGPLYPWFIPYNAEC